ncbi:MAG TPA: glycerophosphodiester phosphodiesterase family protein [Vicinamibacterales bacterium]|nr:glycerophosphodiester phosphodiesterase family protein [Vicinamibacterales bacterium]
MHPAIRASRPLVFAHRGGSKIGLPAGAHSAKAGPENTLAAFDRGLSVGADGLELDVHLSRDKTVVVHHDARLDRTTRAKGLLNERTAEELAALDVPALRDVLARYPDIGIIIELKERGAELATAVVEEVRRANAISRVCLGSFSVSALRAARAAAPGIMTSGARFEVRMALYRSWCGLSPGRVPYQAFQVPETSGRTRVVSPRFVELAHKSGIAVQVWTVDEPEDIRRLLSWGVDGIISDRPDVAAEVVKDWVSRQSIVGSR